MYIFYENRLSISSLTTPLQRRLRDSKFVKVYFHIDVIQLYKFSADTRGGRFNILISLQVLLYESLTWNTNSIILWITELSPRPHPFAFSNGRKQMKMALVIYRLSQLLVGTETESRSDATFPRRVIIGRPPPRPTITAKLFTTGGVVLASLRFTHNTRIKSIGRPLPMMAHLGSRSPVFRIAEGPFVSGQLRNWPVKGRRCWTANARHYRD